MDEQTFLERRDATWDEAVRQRDEVEKKGLRPCIGECGRVSDGVFRDGTHGPGTYCGWCDAIPATA